MSATIPAIHVLHFLTLLERWKIDERAIVGDLGLTRESLAQPGARISLPVVEQLITRGSELSGETALGFYLGWQMRVSAHGFLGFAAMTAATAGAALKLAVRFAPTHTDALTLALREGPETTSLVIEEKVDLGAARQVIISTLMIGIWQMGNALTGHQLGGEAAVTFPEPADYARFKHLLSSPVLFDQPDNRLTFTTSLLDLPLLLADPAAQQLAREQCERDLDALASTRSLVDRVRRLLAIEEGGFRTIHEVARALHMSDRTLKRKLMVEGTSYVELLDAARKERALLLLRSPELTLEQVAEQVGYSELSNFTRAFRRWTGVTPRRFRVP
ncbi:MAG: Transcriptional regulator, AraC family [Myxococcaceae bacterium]|nr:Transcriptional regulator, AraC family [Myxococcaceae bacterium]